LERNHQYLSLDLYWPLYPSLFIWLGSFHRSGIINQTLVLRCILDYGNIVYQEINVQAVHRWHVVCLYIITGKLNKITDTNYFCLRCAYYCLSQVMLSTLRKHIFFRLCAISVFPLKVL
jgi:hypothetical protein